MAEMRSYVKVLRELCEDVKSRVAEAKAREAKLNRVVAEVHDQREASAAELSNLKKTFSFANWFRIKKKSGITAEEAREEAERYSNYAVVVDQIADEEKQLGDAKISLNKAVDDITKREIAQQKVEELMDVLGMIEE